MARSASGRGGNVIRRFASRCLAVVAHRAIGGCRKSAVTGFGTCPRKCGFVARLTRIGRDDVAAQFASGRLAVMATGATGHDRHIGVKFGRQPTGVAVLVTGVASRRRGDVIGILA